MKKFVLLFLLAGIVGCVESDYDLSKIDSDDMTIGVNESEIAMPLARITLSVSRLSQNTDADKVSILELYNEADIWLPSVLPGGVDYVEVDRLSQDEAYLNTMLEALFAEMDADTQKRTEVCTLLAQKYRQPFVNFLPAGVPEAEKQEILSADEAEAAEAIARLYLELQGEVTESITSISSTYLSDMHLDDVEYDIPALDISSDVRDMLGDNLDDANDPNPVSALYLSGTIDSEFPLQFRLAPQVEDTQIDFGEIVVNSLQVTQLDEVRFFENDLDRIFEGSRLTMPVVVERYYPHSGLRADQEIHIHLNLRKTGGLKL